VWLPGDHACVLFGRLRMSLNLAGEAFPLRMGHEGRLAMQEKLLKALALEANAAHSGFLRGLDGAQEEFLSERWLQEPVDWGHGDTLLVLEEGEERDWLLTGEDHLRLGARGAPERLGQLAASLDRSARLLEKEPGIAVDGQGRRLVANPFLCGSGCHAALMLHLPALAWWGQVEEQLDPLYDQGLGYRTWQEGLGDFLVLESLRGEDTPIPPSQDTSQAGRPVGDAAGLASRTLSRLLAAVAHLEEAEEAARAQLRRHRRLELEDRVHRAHAACRSARLMGYPELVEHISMLRLGRQMAGSGLHLPEEGAPLTPLLLHLAPAHLEARSDAGRDGRQASALRARLLRAEMS
jgi:protein arginine kinase